MLSLTRRSTDMVIIMHKWLSSVCTYSLIKISACLFLLNLKLTITFSIGVVIIDDEATLKRVYYYPDKQRLVLQPENKKYEPLVYVGEELETIRIIGKTVTLKLN